MPETLIVGSGGGLGAALADVYRRHGWSVRAVDRAACNLADPDAVAALAQDLHSRLESPELCIFSAGVEEAGYVDQLDPAAFRRCLEVNFLAPVALFHAAATATHPCRRFVFVISGVADLLVPGLAPYALSKRALRDFLAVVRLERSFPECRILAVWPGAMATDFNRKARVHGQYSIPQGARPQPTRDVAERIYEAERSGKRRLVLSPVPRVLGWLQALAPAPLDWLIARHPRFRRQRC